MTVRDPWLACASGWRCVLPLRPCAARRLREFSYGRVDPTGCRVCLSPWLCQDAPPASPLNPMGLNPFTRRALLLVKIKRELHEARRQMERLVEKLALLHCEII